MVKSKVEVQWVYKRMVFVMVTGKWKWINPPTLEEREILRKRLKQYLQHRLRQLPLSFPISSVEFNAPSTHGADILFNCEVEVAWRENQMFNHLNAGETIGKDIVQLMEAFDDPNLE